tara:strand:+ start:2749 stop:6885 length:4137 start_codon:yes stop_codon:yes gene_type:complete
MGHKKSIGLRGGPNEYITDISEFVSIEGYKRNSPDVNNPFNLIDSGSITMEGVDFPVMGTDNLGNSQMMTPGNNYQFPGDQVFEIPMAKRGGSALPKAQAGGARIQAQANREDQAKREFQINRETGDAVVFVESPTIEKRIYDLYNPHAVNENMPSTLKEFQNQFNLGESKLKVIHDKRLSLIENDKEKQKLFNVWQDMRTQHTNAWKKTGLDWEEYQKTPEHEKKKSEVKNAKAVYYNKTYEISDAFNLKHKDEIDLYTKIILDNQRNFQDNKLNPITKRMDSTFYKEAENLKKVYGKLHPNSNVDIVPIYDNPDLIRDKVSGLNPNDSMYFFGHSGDRLGGIPNEEIATILGDSKAENCYLGSCGFERQIEPFQKALQGKNLQYRPEGSWWGVNPGGSSIEDAMWSRVDNNKKMEVEGDRLRNGAKIIKPTLGKDYDQLQRGGEQPKTWKDIEINKEGLKRAIAEVESINGVLMINPESTATGLYGQRFSELEEGKLYEGTRDEFAKDLEAQNRIFDMRLNEGIKSNRTTPLLKDAFDLTNEYKDQLGDKWNYSYEDLITLSNFLGRGGTREFLGNVIRDGKTLEEVYPTKFGKGAKQSNKTPYEYLEKTRDYYQRGREVREIAQDNTRVVKPRIYDIEPQIENKGNNFLSNPDLDYDPLNNERTEIARDNTYVSSINERNNKILANLVNNPQSDKINLDEVMNTLEEAEEFNSREYDDPVLIADFIKNSNFYSDGWKDMSNATEDEVLDLQNVLVKKGYDVGLTGVDGKYGDRTYQAHKAMVDDNNLDPNVISRYYKNYKEDTKQEVKSIQEKLIDAGYLDDTLFNSNKSSVDGKFGDQTKIALDAYNTDNVEEDPQGEVFNNIPSTLEEERCAAGMCTILEGNEVLTEALGVKYKDAWDLSESMINANNSKEIYNIYTNPAFKNINEDTSIDELKKTTRKVKKNSQTKASDYKVGDIVGLYWDGSSHHGETLESETYNTHSGFVSAIDENGVPIITHNVAGDVRQQPYSELTTAWIRRPDENIKVNSTYDTLDIDTVVPDELAINNLGIRYQTNYQENPERLNQIETIFQRAKYNAQKIPKILNSSVDPEWLESVVIGITGVESGVGNSAPRTVEEARSGKRGLQGIGYDLIGKTDGSISLGIGKRKFDGLDPFAKKYFQINSVEDLADDSKSVDAITYGITKSYETFKDYAKQYPELGLTEEDIRNMSILSYNQGENRLLQTGRVDDERTPQEEVEELRELYDAMVTDVSSTNYRFLNKTGLPIGDLAYNTALSIGAEQASPSYINKVNQYIEDLFPTQIAMTQTEDPFRNSVLARGGEYGVYNNYMTGKYEGTPREKHAMNLYDKLNRVHYKDAKKANMSSPNYIMSHIYKA